MAISKSTPKPPPASPEPPALKTSNQVSTEMLDFSLDEAQSFVAEDMTIPRLRVIQSNSPIVTRGAPEYDVNARPGMLMNSATQELFSGDPSTGGVVLVFCFYALNFTQWVPRDDGGGLVRDWGQSHDWEHMVLDKTAYKPTITEDNAFSYLKPQVGNDEARSMAKEYAGNEIVRSADYFSMLVDPEACTWQPIVFGMGGTQLKKSRKLNVQIDNLRVPRPGTPGASYKPPMFLSWWKISTVPEKKGENNWEGVNVSRLGWIVDPADQTEAFPGATQLYLACRKFKQDVEGGKVKADAANASDGGGTSTSDSEAF